MAVITFPSGLYPERMSWAQQRLAADFRSIFGAQSLDAAPPVWTVSVQFGKMTETQSGALKALLLQLRGATNPLAIWDMGRPAPVGTMRGTMTLASAVSAGAQSIPVTAGVGQAAKTLVRGDWLGLGSGTTQQVVMVVADAVANASGVITAAIEPPLRNAFASGAAVTWDKPKALFRRQSASAGWDYESTFASGFALNLLEDWRP
jgi:hypothetical protein